MRISLATLTSSLLLTQTHNDTAMTSTGSSRTPLRKAKGVHGTYHMGCWQVKGHRKTPSSKLDSLPDHAHIARLQKELMKGAMAVLTKPVNFLYGVVDPQDRAEFVDVQQKTFMSEPIVENDPLRFEPGCTTSRLSRTWTQGTG
jgi:hypothetical protein